MISVYLLPNFPACLLYEWLDNNSLIGACLSFILPALYFGPV